MKYFHRTPIGPDDAMALAARFFGGRLSAVEAGARRRRYTGAIGQLTVTAEPEGGHYTLVVVETNQPGESELDRVAKRFLGVVHTAAEPGHALRGAY